MFVCFDLYIENAINRKERSIATNLKLVNSHQTLGKGVTRLDIATKNFEQAITCRFRYPSRCEEPALISVLRGA